MVTIAERIGALELRVNGLETWAGPGQASVLAAGLQAVRSDLAILRRIQESMLRTQQGMLGDLASLRSTQEGMLGTQQGMLADLASLRSTQQGILADMRDMKETLREVLRRLPPPALAS